MFCGNFESLYLRTLSSTLIIVVWQRANFVEKSCFRCFISKEAIILLWARNFFSYSLGFYGEIAEWFKFLVLDIVGSEVGDRALGYKYQNFDHG